MRIDRQRFDGESRDRGRVVSPMMWNASEGEEQGKNGRKGKQDKGSVSGHTPTLCLHILLLRDRDHRQRDCDRGNDGIPPFIVQIREIAGHRRG
jgi:hypothetical protein